MYEKPAIVEAPAAAGRGEHVLVVDDEPGLRELARAVLDKAGYRVTVAEDGRRGVAAYREHRGTIDLVRTDLRMPNLDGHGMIATIRGLDHGAKIAVCSGAANAVTNADNPPPGACVFLAKPYTMESLRTTVRTALDM